MKCLLKMDDGTIYDLALSNVSFILGINETQHGTIEFNDMRRIIPSIPMFNNEEYLELLGVMECE